MTASPTKSAESVVLAEGVVVLVARTYGEAGYRKRGPFHLVNRSQLTNLAGYPEYQGSAVLQAWCGARIRLGPAEVLHERKGLGKWAPGGLNAGICQRCFLRRA